MLSAYVGEEKFLKGVSVYLKKHLYANSVTKDLWDGISEVTGRLYSSFLLSFADFAVGLDIATMMTNWVSKVLHGSSFMHLFAFLKYSMGQN